MVPDYCNDIVLQSPDRISHFLRTTTATVYIYIYKMPINSITSICCDTVRSEVREERLLWTTLQLLCVHNNQRAWKLLDRHITLMIPFILTPRLFSGLNGIKIENQGKQSMLIFFNVSEGDYGNYTCVAMNTMGMTNASIILYGEVIHPVYLCESTCFVYSDRPVIYFETVLAHVKSLLKGILFKCTVVKTWSIQTISAFSFM